MADSKKKNSKKVPSRKAAKGSEQQNYLYSDTQFEIMKRYIKDFEDNISDDEDIALMMTHFGETVTMAVTEISYEKPVLMVYCGKVKGVESTLVQHVTQLNFLLTTTKRAKPELPRKRIGFKCPPDA